MRVNTTTGQNRNSPLSDLGGYWRARFIVLLALIGTTLPGWMDVASADELAAPTGKVLLRISGAIDKVNIGDEAHFDLAMLQALPTEQFDTLSPWDEAVASYEGIRLNVLLDSVGAATARFTASAIDDYVVEFSGIDLERYPVIVAYQQDGKPLSVRTLGPLRIMFPFDDHPELLNQSNMTMSVWQLTRMHVH